MRKRFIEEDTHIKTYDSKLARRLLQEIAPYRRQVIIAFVFLVMTSLLSLVGPYLIKVAIDEYIANNDMAGLINIVIFFVGVLLLQYITAYIRIYYTQYVGQKSMYSLRVKLFSHIQKLPVSFFDRNPVGRVMTRVTNDIEVLNELFSAGVITIFGDLLMLFGIIVLLLFLNYKLALVAFSVLPLLVFITLAFRKIMRESYRNTREKTAKVNSFLQENITGMKIVQLFARESNRHKNFTTINEEYKNAFFKTITAYSLFFPMIELLGSISIALIIYYGGIQLLGEKLTLGALVAFVEYLRKFFVPIRYLTEKYNILQSAMASSERVYKLLDAATEEDVPMTAESGQRFRGEIEFKDVSFAYVDDEYVLKNISFKINAGERVAFVGATGAGKTSIINLISAFYKIQKGEILIDGRDIYSYPKEQLRKNLGVVLQDVFIFSGTILENITLNKKGISLEQVERACNNTYVCDFIEKLPKRYGELVGERGAVLSAGQRQLLSFARVLIYNPTVLILDEATSTVDPHTEYLIQKATEKLMEKRTSIIIAHRLSTIQNVDRIFVFHKGCIVEIGTHEELYAQKGVYYKLHQLQYKNFTSDVKE